MMTSIGVHRGFAKAKVAAAGGVLAVVLIGAGCDQQSAATSRPSDSAGAGGDTKSREPVTIRLAAVRVEPVDVAIDLTGTLYGDESVVIAAKVPGRIAAWYHDFGDRVDEGEQLAQIDKTDYELVVAQQEASLGEALSKLGLKALPGQEFDPTQVATVQRSKVQADNASAKLERARKLFDQKPPLLSGQDFADIETAQQVARHDYDVAILQTNSDLATARVRQSQLASARQRLADTRIVAPKAGEPARAGRHAVARRAVAVGSYVRESDPLFELVADDPVRFRAAVPERFMSTLKIGQTVRLTLESGVRAEGKIARINPNIDIATRTFEVEASIANGDHALRPGAFVRASIVTGQDADATFVPRSAVTSFAGVNRVFSVTDSKASEHRVTLGEVRGDHVRVSPALKNVLSVALGPVGRLGEGMPVKVDTSPVPETALPR